MSGLEEMEFTIRGDLEEMPHSCFFLLNTLEKCQFGAIILKIIENQHTYLISLNLRHFGALAKVAIYKYVREK
ncbi:hypothetical protein XENTR_v10014680 [Xenopus tropicalis]|nr:hypothetical protein XENTR_v10014680 [Xenopus tropicalis]